MKSTIMKKTLVEILVLLQCGVVWCSRFDTPLYYGKFPDNFIWSSATSSYQIEGAWNEDGKGLSIWDTFANISGKIADGSNGMVACDSYHKYEEDIQLLKDLNVSHYRFSISWPRVLPKGTKDQRNQKGIDYYHKLIDAMLKVNIQPMVTLYHWDLPQALEDVGGWLNESMIDYFNDYSTLCFEEYGAKVKFWITFNEPWIVAWKGYGVGEFAPGRYGPGNFTYIAGHNIIKAHAKAYHTYHDKFNKTQGGEIGITLNVGWSEPKDPNNTDDIAASNRALQFDMGWFAHPIFINGDYPDVMKWQVGNKSMLQNLTESRLPVFTEAEKAEIRGTSDFFGLNFYTSSLVTTQIKPLTPISYENDMDTKGEKDPSWLGSGSGWLSVTPFGMRKILKWIKDQYNDPEIYVTENGVSDTNASLTDEHRIYYYKYYTNNVLRAIIQDGCRVRGYTAWSLLDNFEWGQGYKEKFGLHYVNFSDPSRPRTAKASARYYAQLVTDNGFFESPSTAQPTRSSPSPTNAAVSWFRQHVMASIVALLLATIMTIINH